MQQSAAEAEIDKLAALCGTLRLHAGSESVAGQLLEPVACALGAESAAYRHLRLRDSRPEIVSLSSIGVPDTVSEDYLDHFHRIDPFLARLGQSSPGSSPLPGSEHERASQRRQDFPMFQAPGANPLTGEAFRRYYEEFLLPNGLVRHTGFLIREKEGHSAWVFNFHRRGSAPDFSPLELARARLVQACLQGQTGCQVTVATPGLADLTSRERDVVKAVSSGLANKEIATRLSISPRTVENHLRNIYEKLHVNTRTQLLAIIHLQDYSPDRPLIE